MRTKLLPNIDPSTQQHLHKVTYSSVYHPIILQGYGLQDLIPLPTCQSGIESSERQCLDSRHFFSILAYVREGHSTACYPHNLPLVGQLAPETDDLDKLYKQFVMQSGVNISLSSQNV